MERRRRHETRSADEARAIMARAWSRHDILPVGSGLHLRFDTVALGSDVSVSALSYGTEVRIRPVDRDRVVLVQMPLAGTAGATFGSVTVPLGADAYAVVDVPRLASATFSADFDMVVLRVRSSRLLSHLEALLGRPATRDLAFEPSMRRGTAAWDAWQPVARALEAMLRREGGTDVPPIAAAWEEVILSALLHGQLNSYSDDLRRLDRSLAPRHVRRAERFIAENAHRPLTTGKVAVEVGVSVRALFDGFKAFRAMSPAEHIRAVRLDRAREDLLAGDLTVAEAASRWGFRHAGNFAAQYRRAFGDLPHRSRRSGA